MISMVEVVGKSFRECMDGENAHLAELVYWLMI